MSKRRRAQPILPTPSPSTSPISEEFTIEPIADKTSPVFKRRRLNRQTRSTPFEESNLLPTPEDDRATPPIVEIQLKTPKTESKDKAKVKISNKVKVDLLEECMDFLYEEMDFGSLSKKFKIPKQILKNEFKSYTGHPKNLTHTNIRKSVSNIFDMNPAFLIPDIDHLEGLRPRVPKNTAQRRGSNGDTRMRKQIEEYGSNHTGTTSGENQVVEERNQYSEGDESAHDQIVIQFSDEDRNEEAEEEEQAEDESEDEVVEEGEEEQVEVEEEEEEEEEEEDQDEDGDISMDE